MILTAYNFKTMYDFTNFNLYMYVHEAELESIGTG